jgi:hypothetical protein
MRKNNNNKTAMRDKMINISKPNFYGPLALTFTTLIALSFSLACTTIAHAHGMSEAEKATTIGGSNLQYIWLGITNMLSGFDHLAFVFGIIFFLKSFKEIAKYVTAFTLGHSITLIYATLNGIQFNYYIIDAIIALSVCYIAFHNLGGFQKYFKVPPPNMLLMIFTLGLINGFGLSSILQELPLDQNNLWANIISFNIGIELGQLLALAAMLLFITAIRSTNFFTAFSTTVNCGLILAGAALYCMQMYGFTQDQDNQDFIRIAKTQPKKVETKKEISFFQPLSDTNLSWQDTIKVTVPANNGIEYKFDVKKDATFSYTWKTENDEQLFFDFHGEPKGNTTGYFKSYKEKTDKMSSGTLRAPFEGTHGWYWANETAKPITVILKAVGSYTRKD